MRLRRDLAALDALDPAVKTDDHDPKTRTYKERTREEILESIHDVEELIEGSKAEMPAAVEATSFVPEELRRERGEILENYMVDMNAQCLWDGVDFS